MFSLSVTLSILPSESFYWIFSYYSGRPRHICCIWNFGAILRIFVSWNIILGILLFEILEFMVYIYLIYTGWDFFSFIQQCPFASYIMKDDLLDFVLNMLSIKSSDFLKSIQIHIRKKKGTKQTTKKKLPKVTWHHIGD